MGTLCLSGGAVNGESSQLLSHAASALAQLLMLLSRVLGSANHGILLVFKMLNIIHR